MTEPSSGRSAASRADPAGEPRRVARRTRRPQLLRRRGPRPQHPVDEEQPARHPGRAHPAADQRLARHLRLQCE